MLLILNVPKEELEPSRACTHTALNRYQCCLLQYNNLKLFFSVRIFPLIKTLFCRLIHLPTGWEQSVQIFVYAVELLFSIAV